VQVVAVTGSVGKTSTKDAVASLLSTRFRVLRSTGNRNTEIGLPLALLDLQPVHQRAVLEMGMYQRGDIALLCRIAAPEVGVVTNVGPTHLARLGSLQTIADAKAELVEALPPGGVAVLNADDAVVAAFSARTAARVVTYGLAPGADCRGEAVVSRGLDGLAFTLVWEGRSAAVTTPLPGRHHVHTALAAAAAALVSGLSVEEVVAGLAGLPSGDRLRVHTARRGFVVLDDSYNASPVSMKAALDLLAETPGRHVAVLGDMMELGDQEGSGHREVGRHVAGRVDCLLAVGSRAQQIAEAARSAGVACVRHVEASTQALEVLRTALRPGDHVLVKGSRSMALDRLAAALDDF
jgi:UDP-N-acetylmuramoyl-tripeptide--D-alanyl-D-alanine ligase